MTPPRVLVTRPSGQSKCLAAALRARHYLVTCEPMLRVATLPWDPARVSDCAGFIVTSANAAAELARRPELNRRKVFAVGEGSARPLLAAGFQNVECAEGSARTLLECVAINWRPKNGALCYLSGAVVTRDIADDLRRVGYDARRVVVYDAQPARRLNAGVQDKLRGRAFDAALFMSPRTAESFIRLAHSARLPQPDNVICVALSDRIVRPLRALDWRKVETARTCSQEGLLVALERSLAA